MSKTFFAFLIVSSLGIGAAARVATATTPTTVVDDSAPTPVMCSAIGHSCDPTHPCCEGACVPRKHPAVGNECKK